MNRDGAVPPAMTANGFNVDGAEEGLAAHRPNLATNVASPPNAYTYASLAREAPVPGHDPVLGVRSVTLTVASVPVMEKGNPVSVTEIGPGITLGYHSLDEYKFITNLVVIEEN